MPSGHCSPEEESVQAGREEPPGQGPLAEGVHLLLHQLGQVADRLVAIPVAEQEPHDPGHLAVRDAAGVESQHQVRQVWSTPGVAGKKARGVPSPAVPGHFELHLAKGGLQLARVMTTRPAAVLPQEGPAVQLQ